MKNALLVLAMIATVGCHASVPVQNQSIATYVDKGSKEAVICHAKSDAIAIVKLAGDNDGEKFRTVTKNLIVNRMCRFMGNEDEIQVTAHEVVMTNNGPLFVIQFRQGDSIWWAGANYFPGSYPRTMVWEDELGESE